MFTCQLPKTLQIFVAVISACLGVYFPPNPSPYDNSLGIFAIQRALCLFPIFVLGQHVDLQGLLRVIPGPSKTSHPCVAVVWLLMMSLIAIENQQETWRTVTFGAFDSMNSQPMPFMQYQPDTKCPGDQYFAWARIFSALIYRVICMFLFLLFAVPREKTWFTEAGSRTFYPYLLHFPFMAWLNWTLCWLNNEHGWHLFDPGYFNFMRLAFGLTCYYVLLVYGLASKPVVMLFSPLLEPTWIQRLFRHGLPPKEVVMKGWLHDSLWQNGTEIGKDGKRQSAQRKAQGMFSWQLMNVYNPRKTNGSTLAWSCFCFSTITKINRTNLHLKRKSSSKLPFLGSMFVFERCTPKRDCHFLLRLFCRLEVFILVFPWSHFRPVSLAPYIPLSFMFLFMSSPGKWSALSKSKLSCKKDESGEPGVAWFDKMSLWAKSLEVMVVAKSLNQTKPNMDFRSDLMPNTLILLIHRNRSCRIFESCKLQELT